MSSIDKQLENPCTHNTIPAHLDFEVEQEQELLPKKTKPGSRSDLLLRRPPWIANKLPVLPQSHQSLFSPNAEYRYVS